MAVYDLEEQDQLEDLKSWWKQWGNYVTTIVLAVCVGIVGVQGWRWWQHSEAEQASVLYSALSTAARENDAAKAKEAMAELAAKHAGTGYAPRGAMVVAKVLFESGEKAGAKTQLQWAIEKTDDDSLREIARYRLAEVQFDKKQNWPRTRSRPACSAPAPSCASASRATLQLPTSRRRVRCQSWNPVWANLLWLAGDGPTIADIA